jgi:hypothetical protein
MAKKRVVRKRSVRKKRTRTSKAKKRTTRKRPATRRRKKVTGKKKIVRKKVAHKKSKPRKRKKASPRKVLKQVERVSVERTVAGKRRRARKRSAPKAKKRYRRRAVSGIGGKGLLVGLAVGVGAYLLLTNMSKTSTTTTPYYGQYGTLNQTANVTRNTQSQDILNYAIAAGLAADLIGKLIDRMNSSSDEDLKNTYDYVNTTGDINALV